MHFILEYAFGGHPFPFTGIFDMMPRDLTELGEGFNFKYVTQFQLKSTIKNATWPTVWLMPPLSIAFF